MAKRQLKVCVLCRDKYLSWRKSQIFCSKSCAAKGSNNNSYSHGLTNTPTYTTWSSMVKRIKKPHYKSYDGIYLDPDWLKFENFYKDMGERPNLDYSLDRIDNTKGYYKENCRWSTRKEQMNNTSRNKIIIFDGKSLTQSQWADRVGIDQNIICKRLKRGWSIERALMTPKMR